MLVKGEDFRFSVTSALQVVVPPMQLDGDAPNHDFEVVIRNDGPGPMDIVPQESNAAGGAFTGSINRSGAAASLSLVSGAEGTMRFVTLPGNNWLQFVATPTGATPNDSADCLLKFQSVERPPINY